MFLLNDLLYFLGRLRGGIRGLFSEFVYFLKDLEEFTSEAIWT